MRLDPLAEQVGIGGAVAVLLVGMVMKFLPAFMSALRQQNGSRNGNKAGERSTEEWEGRMRKMHDEAGEHLMKDMRMLMDTRTQILVEKVTEPIVKELRGLRDDLARRDRET